MKAFIIGKYVGSNVGGAELSSFELAKSLSPESVINIRLSKLKKFKGNEFKNFDNFKTIDYPQYKILSLWSVYFIPYLYYKLKKEHIAKEYNFIKKGDIAIGVGIESIPILLELNCKSIFVARSPNDLSLTPIYGFKFLKLKRLIKFSIDYIPALLFRKLLKKFIASNNEFAVNSIFMKELAIRILRIKNEQIKIYIPKPFISKTSLKLKNKVQNNLIKLIIVGNDECKGINIFKRISKSIHKKNISEFKYKCICISRAHTEKKYSKKFCLHYYPWGTLFEILDQKSIVLIPSLWQEAFCRVARECNILNIPVVAFNRGGIPEALNGHKRSILLKYNNNIEDWLFSINEFSKNI